MASRISKPGTVIDFPRLQAACAECSHRELCLPCGVPGSALKELEEIMTHHRLLEGREVLFRSGDPFRSLYVVRAGSVKTFIVTEAGAEQVTGFHLPGEVIGLDAIAGGRHACFAQALETASVCEVPFPRFEELARRVPELQQHLLRLMSNEIRQDEALITLLGGGNAEQRFAAFLLSLSCRFRKRGYSPREFHLSMSRKEIASYLGLALETVSRFFSRFHRGGLITVDGKRVRLNDIEALRAIALGGSGAGG